VLEHGSAGSAPPPSDGGEGNNGTGGALPVLAVTAKGHIKVVCLGPRRPPAEHSLRRRDLRARGEHARAAASWRSRSTRRSTKGQVVLKIKLNRDGRSASGAANQLPSCSTTVTDRDG
jgi:hypothetical protein